MIVIVAFATIVIVLFTFIAIVKASFIVNVVAIDVGAIIPEKFQNVICSNQNQIYISCQSGNNFNELLV